MLDLEKEKYLGVEKVSKLLMKFSIPCILSLLISSLYNIVDQIFIGNSNIGYLGNAATTVVFPITLIALAFAWCLGNGTAAYLSIAQGRQDTENIHKCVGNSILATVVIGLIFTVICFIFADPILYMFGASDVSIGLARDYFFIIMAVMPLFMLMNMMNSIIRADGSPSYEMLAMIIGAVINVILDPLFIFVFDWGIKGAAYATIIGQIISFAITLVYFLKPKSFKLQLKSFVPHLNLFFDVIKLGISTFITQISIVLTLLICNVMLVKYGASSDYGQDIPIAVIGIAMKVYTIVISIVVGIILGAQPILGYNFGAKKYDRVKETFKIVIITTTIIGLIATVMFEVFPQVIINLFGAQSDLYNEFALLTFRIYLSLIVFTCIIKVMAIFFQAVSQPFKATIISIILPSVMGIKGILWAAPISDVIGMIVTVIYIIIFFKNLDKDHSRINLPN